MEQGGEVFKSSIKYPFDAFLLFLEVKNSKLGETEKSSNKEMSRGAVKFNVSFFHPQPLF